MSNKVLYQSGCRDFKKRIAPSYADLQYVPHKFYIKAKIVINCQCIPFQTNHNNTASPSPGFSPGYLHLLWSPGLQPLFWWLKKRNF